MASAARQVDVEPDYNRSSRGRGGAQRKHLLFYGGLIGDRRRDDPTGRGGLYVLYRNHSDYHVVNSGPHHHERADFSEEMQVCVWGAAGASAHPLMPRVGTGKACVRGSPRQLAHQLLRGDAGVCPPWVNWNLWAELIFNDSIESERAGERQGREGEKEESRFR